MMMMTYKEV